MLDSLRLDGKVAIVTGASRGLGRAMAHALAEAGADCVLASRSLPDLDVVSHEIEALGRQALALRTDVARFEDMEKLASAAHQRFGRIDILVNNAGVAVVKPFIEITREEWSRILDTNLSGVVNGCRAVGPYFIAQKSGKVINIASAAAVRALPGYSAYSLTKAGVVSLTKSLAVEWARHNVQVNAIGPGWFITPMNESAFADEKIRERLLRDVPARRTGKPEELGPLVVYLASPASDFVTGETIFIDGGSTAA